MTSPRQLRFEFALWTREMVRELVRRQFGVGLSAVSVGRLLARMGLSPQRPAYPMPWTSALSHCWVSGVGCGAVAVCGDVA